MSITFRVQLVGVTKPPIWRKIVTPNTATFIDLHEAIQDAFGWLGYHLWCFSEKRRAWDGWQIECDEADDGFRHGGEDFGYGFSSPNLDTPLRDVITQRPFYYTYDFGDNWLCSVKVLAADDEPCDRCSCIDGKGEDPGEDIGGVWGLMERRAGRFPEDEDF